MFFNGNDYVHEQLTPGDVIRNVDYKTFLERINTSDYVISYTIYARDGILCVAILKCQLKI